MFPRPDLAWPCLLSVFRLCDTGERWLREHPEASAKMMDLLTGVVIDYMAAQVLLSQSCNAHARALDFQGRHLCLAPLAPLREVKIAGSSFLSAVKWMFR